MLAGLSALLRGAPENLKSWIDDPSTKNLRLCLFTIIMGFGGYGLTVGMWRAPEMGLYVALKMPLLIFATLACNGLLNGMLGLLLGSGLGFRQSLAAQLVSFTIAALVLGSLAPVTFFMSLNAPPPEADNAASAHANFLVAHTILIAMAGILANLHLAKLLLAVTPNTRTAATTMAAWLAGNAFVGAQLSWIMRPFFGTPTIEVAFFRQNPFDGTFYETVWTALNRISSGNGLFLLSLILIGIALLHLPVIKLFLKPKKKTMNEPESQSPPPPLPEQPPEDKPLASDASLSAVFEGLLKSPGSVIQTIGKGDHQGNLTLKLLGLTLAGFLIFGITLGSFSFGTQIWAAPLKTIIGIAFSAVICLPSLYIFSALTGTALRLREIIQGLAASLALIAALLLGFTPVLWVFSQSTSSEYFFGFLVVLAWLIAVGFGTGFLLKMLDQSVNEKKNPVRVWIGIFLLVTLQMSTSLRPLIGTSNLLFTAEKRFFLEHWINEAKSSGDESDSADPLNTP